MRSAVQAPNNNQSPSTPRLLGRVDRGPNTRPPPRSIQLMDDVLRRVQNTAGSRSRHHTCLPTLLSIYGDSNLVVQQAMRDRDTVADNMMAYQKLYNTLEGGFDGCELDYVSRANN